MYEWKICIPWTAEVTKLLALGHTLLAGPQPCASCWCWPCHLHRYTHKHAESWPRLARSCCWPHCALAHGDTQDLSCSGLAATPLHLAPRTLSLITCYWFHLCLQSHTYSHVMQCWHHGHRPSSWWSDSGCWYPQQVDSPSHRSKLERGFTRI